MDAWLLDASATFHMNFWRDSFEEFNDNVEGAVYFAYRSSQKPIGIGTIRLKFSIFLDFLLHDVLYIPKLWRNLKSLVHIQQQAHYIHMFYGKL
jgi:hypothetical protein